MTAMTAMTAANELVGGHHHVELVMGMAVSIDIRAHVPVERDRLVAATDAVVAWLHHVDATWSTYKDESPITRLGRGELRAEDLTQEMNDVLDLCEIISADTNGAFDIHVPAPNGTMLETSGLVKGWCIERAAWILEEHGLTDFSINAGGDIVLRGEPSPGEPWRTGIRHPELDQMVAATLATHGRLAIATSATYERGKHIVDPRTGQPAEELASVTIVGEDLTFVDAYATAVYVMGLDGLVWLHENHPDFAAFAITRDAMAYSTPGFDQYRDPAAI